ncbi:MarR family winged helix-turn-helix transcriptional regulator [Henriciella sp.]|uniref:MarR family winged helix-turn-helix transcriptional regulator n=1 Tax=Henriciella sp. TaxID=1968823 RepID=UPI0025C2F8A9|nr:MarR family winged helix-turn-helix transcriptional regulator [Henriciella sp.]
MTQIYEAALASSGMTVGQFGLLARIIKQPGVSLGALANAAGMDQSSLSRTIRLIEKAGYTEFGPAPDDARVKALFPTPSGITAFELAAAQWRQAHEDVGQRLTPEFQETLRGQCAAALQVLNDRS